MAARYPVPGWIQCIIWLVTTVHNMADSAIYPVPGLIQCKCIWLLNIRPNTGFKKTSDIQLSCRTVRYIILMKGVQSRDVNDNTSSLIIKLRYRIVSIAKRNENVQKCKTVIESKI